MKAAVVRSTVFLGGGRITSALIAGLRLSGYKRPIVVHDRNPEKLRRLKRELVGSEFRLNVARNLKSAVERAAVLIIAVRPDSVRHLLDEVGECGAAIRSTVVVSLAAGVPLRALRSRSGSAMHWVRAMPSPVCRVGRGFTAVTFDDAVTVSERRRARNLFAQVGTVVEIPESQFDAFTAAYSPSHGYHALAVLAKAGQGVGLDRGIALAAAAHALADGIFYWKQAGQTIDELLQEAATPGGTAAATLSAMNRAGYERVVSRGLAAGMKQARRNAKR